MTSWETIIAYIFQISLYQTGSEIRVKCLIFLCSQSTNLKRVTLIFDWNIFQAFCNFCEFRNNREESIHFLFGSRQKRASVGYIYCKICSKSYRFYTAIITIILRPVRMAALSRETMKLLRQGPRPLKSGYEFCSEKVTF